MNKILTDACQLPVTPYDIKDKECLVLCTLCSMLRQVNDLKHGTESTLCYVDSLPCHFMTFSLGSVMVAHISQSSSDRNKPRTIVQVTHRLPHLLSREQNPVRGTPFMRMMNGVMNDIFFFLRAFPMS